ncbi:chemotaxis protein CheW [Marinoscillum sp. MHG1-6]|uniref:chemotaxis protein CheW n=1 Tax=Marinoscillum sp. MHG1-6 TaxID=2959627 RepID=UPI0021588237|nr:chemotaxis protein CheW [Marinoscillum sp. MHG1-6]
MTKRTQESTLAIKDASWVEHAESMVLDYGQDQSGEKEEKISIVVFQVGEELYGTPISAVKEVVRAPQISPIPQTEDYILGVTNVRGNIVAVLDAEMRITKSEIDNSKQFLVVLSDENIKLGMLIGSVPFTININKSSINQSTSVIHNLTEEDKFVTGLIKHEDKMIFLIDLVKMI